MSRGQRHIAIECKASSSPKVRRGFWSALADTKIEEAWVLAPVDEVYPLKDGVQVAPLKTFLEDVAPGLAVG